MAQQVTISLTVNALHDSLRREFKSGPIQYAMSAQEADRPLVNVTNTGVTITIEDVTAPGLICFQNMSETETIQIGPDDGLGTRVPFMKVSPGRAGMIELESSGVVLKAITTTDPANLDVFVLSE